MSQSSSGGTPPTTSAGTPGPPLTSTEGTTTVVGTLPSGPGASNPSSSSSSSQSTPSSSSSIVIVSSTSPTTSIPSVSSISTTPQTTSSDTSTTALSTISTTSDTSASRISRLVSTRSDGGVVTITTIVDAETSSTGSSDNNKSGENVGFLQNKTAMAATFAIAGLVAAILAFLFITTCIRRRRAMKFDRDVAAAAAAAAAESHAVQPFDDDDDDDVFTGAPRAHGSGYGYAPGKAAEHDPYGYAAAGVVGGGPGVFGAPPQPMRQPQTGAPLAYPTTQQYPIQPYDQPYNGGVFGRQVGQQEVYNMQDLGIPADMSRRPGSAGTGHDTLPGIAGVGTQGSASGPVPGPGPGRDIGFSALVGAAGLAGSAGAAAAAAFRDRHNDPYGGYVTSPVGESRYPQPRWSQQQISQPMPPERPQSGWYQQQGQQPLPRAPSPPASASTHGPAPAYSPPPGGLTAQGYPNEKSTYSNPRSVTSAQTSSNEGPSTSGHTVVSTNVPGTPLDEDDVGSVLEGHEGPRVLKVTNE